MQKISVMFAVAVLLTVGMILGVPGSKDGSVDAFPCLSCHELEYWQSEVYDHLTQPVDGPELVVIVHDTDGAVLTPAFVELQNGDGETLRVLQVRQYSAVGLFYNTTASTDYIVIVRSHGYLTHREEITTIASNTTLTVELTKLPIKNTYGFQDITSNYFPFIAGGVFITLCVAVPLGFMRLRRGRARLFR